jgi:hypothetical protein
MKKAKKPTTKQIRVYIDSKSAKQLENLSTVWPLSLPQLAGEAIRKGIVELTKITVANFGQEALR